MPNTNTYKGIYAMHKYWGKKPFNEISNFIERYSSENDVVLDCFCGSGVTLVESLKLSRKCIGIDINPIAIKLSKVLTTKVDKNLLLKEYNKIEKELKLLINSLYEYSIGEDTSLITHIIWKDQEPIEVWYSTKNKKKEIRKGEDFDKVLALHPKISPKWYPQSLMFENSRINVNANQKVSDLFTPRALVALSHIYDEIKNVKDENIRNVLELTFSGTLSQASNLVFVIRNRKKNDIISDRAEVGSWVVGYWVPEEHFEINAWNCFENRFKRILKGVDEINEIYENFSYENLNNAVQINHGTATDMKLNDNTVDYIFIDPPHVNRILYMEMSLMWNSWLKLDDIISWDNEIVISEAKYRNKDAKNYNQLMDKSFGEISRVLKKDKYFSFAFNCLEDATWFDTLNLFIKHGMEFHEILPLEYSATSVIQDNRKNALQTDFVLTFVNKKHSQNKGIVLINDIEKLSEIMYKIYNENPDAKMYTVMNKVFEISIPIGEFFKVSSIIKKFNEIFS